MTAQVAGNAGAWRNAVVAGVLALGGGSIALAQGAQSTCLSGYEVSRGTDVGGGLFKGVTFVGVDNRPNGGGGATFATCNRWTTDGNGGSWTAKIDRIGAAGIGGSGVTVVGGRWYWIDRDDRLRFGRVEGGFVVWPPALDSEHHGLRSRRGVFQTVAARCVFSWNIRRLHRRHPPRPDEATVRFSAARLGCTPGELAVMSR